MIDLQFIQLVKYTVSEMLLKYVRFLKAVQGIDPGVFGWYKYLGTYVSQ